MTKKKKEKKVKKEVVNVEKHGRCLRCGKLMGRNYKSCNLCRRMDRLKRKANKRGKKKNYYTKW
jgi:hypothetical protein